MLVYLACFDIVDDRTRYQVGKALAEYGERVQKSVFEISLHSDTQLKALKEELRPLLDPDDDLRFYALCKACRGRSHTVAGQPVALFPAAVVI
jgi:CRISPR-associated protein Cas2